MAKDVKRLFEQFRPKHYIVELNPDRDDMSFAGMVIINGLRTGRPSKRITLHQSGLTVSSAHIVFHGKKGDEEIPVARINRQQKLEEVRLHADKLIYPGSYTIRLEFRGQISRTMNGIYPCFFKHDGHDKKLIATQFESHHAREVFPCIDEPEAKATFDLMLTTPAGETTVANTPVKSQAETDGNVTTVFETTPHMSTYLLAFVYGELAYKQAKTRSGVDVKVYATPDNVEFTKFALETAVKCLDFYDEYFGIDYPLKKCDLIALPDFASGAMENWGCITFREQTLLVDPKNTSLANKQYVALVVAHELAHQWFGNLVTMRWWNDLWLNEGFASWIEYLAVDHLFPKWQVWTQFVVDEQQQALKLDALEHTHPVEVPVHHPDEIRSIFDAISYSKGASVIHMLHDYLGAERFRDGLRHYLASHAYSNTDTVDLWTSLEEISDKPVKQFMHIWTSQPGFPVVTATVNTRSLTVNQQRFYINPAAKPAKDNQLWPIPLQSAKPVAPEQLAETQARIDIDDPTGLKLNLGQSGFYRTMYNSSHLTRLGALIRKGKMSPLDRLGVLSDLFEGAKAGQADTADALKFLDNFASEENYAVWDVIASGLGSIRMVMGDEQLRAAIKPYTLHLVKDELGRLGWDKRPGETHFDSLLRPIILGLAANADHKSTVSHCRHLFDKIKHADEVSPQLKTIPHSSAIKRNVSIDPDMRGVVFGTIARLGNKNDFDKLLKLHDESQLSEEKVTLAAALTGFKQPKLYTQALGLINSDHVRLQDVAYWLAYSLMNRHARAATWAWVKDNWQWLHDNLGTDLSFYRLPVYVARVHSDIGFLKEYEDFFAPRLSPALKRSYYQGKEILQWQSEWKRRDYSEILNFFERRA